MILNHKCCEQKRDKLIARKENKKKFLIHNPDQKTVCSCTVDDCLITGEQIRCDYLFTIENEALYLVELKGTDHIHALEQIVATAEYLNIISFSGRKMSAIVGSPCPKASSKYQKALKRLSARYKASGVSFPIKKNGALVITV